MAPPGGQPRTTPGQPRDNAQHAAAGQDNPRDNPVHGIAGRDNRRDNPPDNPAHGAAGGAVVVAQTAPGTPSQGRDNLAPARSFASPRPHGTHDTIRNQNRFPGWGSWADSPPQPPMCHFSGGRYCNEICMQFVVTLFGCALTDS